MYDDPAVNMARSCRSLHEGIQDTGRDPLHNEACLTLGDAEADLPSAIRLSGLSKSSTLPLASSSPTMVYPPPKNETVLILASSQCDSRTSPTARTAI